MRWIEPSRLDYISMLNIDLDLFDLSFDDKSKYPFVCGLEREPLF